MPKNPSEPREDYLEFIYELSTKNKVARAADIASYLKVKPASVAKMLQKLAAEGYIDLASYRGFTLTKKGIEVGKKIDRRHKILYSFLHKLGLSENTINSDIHGLEHHLSDETLSKLQAFLKKID